MVAFGRLLRPFAAGRNGAKEAPDRLVKGTRPFEVAGRGKGREDAREAGDRGPPCAGLRGRLGRCDGAAVRRMLGRRWGPFGARLPRFGLGGGG